MTLRAQFSIIVRTVTSNLRWGMSWALAFAFVYVAWISLIFILGGQTAFAKKHVTYQATMLAYIESALAGGLLLSILRPISRWRTGSVLIGVVIGAVVGLTMGFIVEPSTHIDGAHVFVSLVFGTMGAFVAFRWSAPERVKSVNRKQ